MKNIFEAIPKDLTAEVFENLVENENVKIERIISRGHSSPDTGWYDQQHNEWVMVLKGEAKLLFEHQFSVTLKPGDYLEIKSGHKHKVIWTDPNMETIWLAVHY